MNWESDLEQKSPYSPFALHLRTEAMGRILRNHLNDRDDGKFAKIKDKERVEIALK